MAKLTDIPEGKLEICPPGVAFGIYPGSTVASMLPANRRPMCVVGGAASLPRLRSKQPHLTTVPERAHG
jgi:hypothetical protein